MVMVIALGLVFLMSSQPILMVGVLILIALLYSFCMFMYLGSYWFSYVLVMVMLSGVLVVFTYMVSMSPNESFEIYNLVYVIFFLMLFLGLDKMMYGFDYSLMSINLWVSYVSFFNLFLVMFLLSIMLMVVWVSFIDNLAIRVVLWCAWLKD